MRSKTIIWDGGNAPVSLAEIHIPDEHIIAIIQMPNPPPRCDPGDWLQVWTTGDRFFFVQGTLPELSEAD